MINALAHTVTFIGASWSRSQEWLLCARVLGAWLHIPRPYRTAQRNDGVAKSECRPLQVNGLRGYLEQFSRMVRRGRFHMA